MALWSAALFGHYKPRWYLRDRKTGLLVSAHVERPAAVRDNKALFLHPVEGWEFRAEPGDIIAVRPYEERDRWTDTERKQFLIVTLGDFELLHLGGLMECQWDTDSYPVFDKTTLEGLLKKEGYVNLHPQRHIKKRRFHVQLDDLRDMGVDIDRMLNKELRYNPDLDPIVRTRCFDKLNARYARRADGFNLLPPRRIDKVT